MTLSIIILSYNTKDLLAVCLESIYQYLPFDLFEVILVDNASTDGTLSELSTIDNQQLTLKVIRNKENVGFSKGCNIGAKEARGKYLLFLNSDAVLQDNSILGMIESIKQDKNIGVVGGSLLNKDGSAQRSYGKFYGLSHAILMLIVGDNGEKILTGQSGIGNLFRRVYQSGHPREEGIKADWVSGGCMLIRKDLFDSLHGFDEHFFMYMEDMELCYRVKQYGYSIYFFPHATVVHTSQGSSNRSFAIQHIYRGLLYFYKKHKNPMEYSILKAVLWSKAWVLIILGNLTANTYLKTTYRKILGY